MELFEAFEKRHTYRGFFLEQDVPESDLRKIIEAGLKAPSGKNAQTTEFVIITDKSKMNIISKMHQFSKSMQSARAYICCVLDKSPEAVYEGFEFQYEDCAAAVENMLLAITGLGYASNWVDGWLRLEGRAKAIGEIIGLPESKYILIILPIGVPAEKHTQPVKKPFEARAWFNQYGK